jgi:hypothetical protein
MPLFWWGIASVVAMVVGAFGPWVHVLVVSVTGTDASNDAWLVVVLALFVLLCVLSQHTSIGISVVGLAFAVGAVALTLHDRHKVTTAIHEAGFLGHAFMSVGWGLNLALAGSVSAALQAASSAALDLPLRSRAVPKAPRTRASSPATLAEGGLDLPPGASIFKDDPFANPPASPPAKPGLPS